jgi:glucose-1-phosphate thymidylyltransferase
LPVAGLGTRLRPQTWSKPKPLVSVAGRPMLAQVLDRVLPLNPDKLVFITGFLGDQIESFVRAHYEVPAVFIDQPVMRGQSDAIIRAREVATADALILFPDMLFEADFSPIRQSDADAILFTKYVEDPSALGVAVKVGERVTRLVEKPKEPMSNLAVIGIYYFRHMADLYGAIEEQLGTSMSLQNEYFIADAIQIMVDHGKRIVTSNVTEWEDCGNDAALLSTNRFLLDRKDRDQVSIAGCAVIEPSIVHPTAKIERSILGPYASIGACAVIRDSIVRDSIVEAGAVIDFALLDRSIIGRDARVKGHVTNANVGDQSALEF